MVSDFDSMMRRAAVLEALTSVIDPCSQFNGSHLNLVELGMVDGLKVAPDGLVEISLLLDDPTCLYASTICRAVTAAVGAINGVDAVEVAIRSDELWTSDRLSDRAQAKLRDWREERSAMRSRSADVRLRPLT
jgi:metal-sulfur cluster biosynthetic enzyme